MDRSTLETLTPGNIRVSEPPRPGTSITRRLMGTSNRDPMMGVRRCGRCGQSMRCDAVRDHYRGWLHTGTTYHHTCSGCGLRVRTISTWKALVDLGSMSVIVVMCLGLGGMILSDAASRALAGAPVPGMSWGLGAASVALGLLFCAVGAHFAMGVVHRRRHPLIA